MEIESVTWFSSFFTFFTAPMPSTCPCTMWPERNDFGVAGSSRFTRFPFLRAPKFVRSKVSDMTSAKKELPVFLVTVKHAPLMLMLSPFLDNCSCVCDNSAEHTTKNPLISSGIETVPLTRRYRSLFHPDYTVGRGI